jgi:hypothetical protein|tara:strand:- start:625 stop:834 length:210 start_codon:yes stop_codon:yes gene_type:complete
MIQKNIAFFENLSIKIVLMLTSLFFLDFKQNLVIFSFCVVKFAKMTFDIALYLQQGYLYCFKGRYEQKL